MNIFSHVKPHVNSLTARDINIILKAMINMGYNDKKFLHLLSTVYLKNADYENFFKFITTFYYFAVLDLENIIFSKKIIEVISLEILIVNHYLDGNENLNSLQGMYDKDFIRKLNFLSRNVQEFKDQITDFEKIKYNENELFSVLDILIKTIWSVSYFVCKEKMINNIQIFKEFMKNLIKIFNNFISNLKASEESGVQIKLTKPNIEKFLQAYFFFLLHTKKLELNINLNSEFLKLQNLEIVENNDEIYDYEKFSKFRDKVLQLIKINTDWECLEVEYQDDYSDISSYDVFKYLKCDFVRMREKDGKKIPELIFINNPYDYFEITTNSSGFNKFRQNLCSQVNLNYLEIDYAEFLIFNKDITISENNLESLVWEFIHLKLN
jgi:hypothetical protein